MRAWLNLRLHAERNKMFARGLKRHGYQPEIGVPCEPQAGDILVTWNRIGPGAVAARKFEARGFPVLVVENASWGNSFAGDTWYHIAQNQHNTAGRHPVGDGSRWDSLRVELPEFRRDGETVILPQRGIGSDPVRMPAWFAKQALKDHGGRVRMHPGRRPSKPLEADLAHCRTVITWGSGAAIKALLLGCRAVSYMPKWIGEQDNTEAGRLAMFQRLAWAQWRWSEIESGAAFEHLIHR